MKNILHSKPLLLADENIPIEIIKNLSSEGFDIKRVSLGSRDEEVFKFAKSENRVLLTFDKHFLNRLKFPLEESSGIIFININSSLIDLLYSSILKLFNNVESSKFKKRFFILSISRFKVFPKF